MTRVAAARRRGLRRLAAACGVAALTLTAPGAGAQGQAPAAPAAPRSGAPLAPVLRGTQTLEPPRIAVGDVAAIELLVTTPPEHRVRFAAPVTEVAGLWVLESEALATEREPARWVHRTRLRVRAREPGIFVWPAQRAEVEGPDGTRQAIELAAFPIEVVSVLPEFPERLTPFGLRAPALPARGEGGLLAPLAAGAALALAALALLALVRRERARRREAAPSAAQTAAATPPWLDAQQALAAAQSFLERDPRRAADAASQALRRYVAARFGADAVARTTPELEAATPPFSATSRWPALVGMLRRLDALRFPPPRAGEAESLRALLTEAQAFVADSIPPEALR